MVLGSGNDKTKWIHSPESLLHGRITYTVKFVGKAEVPEPRGMAMVKAALQKLTFSRQLKRSEGAKPPKVELGISVHSVSITDIKTKETLHSISLHRVSFCADDKEDKRLFAFIAKLEDNKHYCYGLDSLHQANDITLTIGQAFELAYQKFMKDNQLSSNTKKVTDMSKRIQELESENNELRRRIAELEASQQTVQNGSRAATTTAAQVCADVSSAASLVQLNTETVAMPRRSSPPIAPVATPQQEAIDAFNMQPFVPTSSLTRLPQPPSRKPVKSQGLWQDDLFHPIQNPKKTSSELVDMQNAFSRGLVVSDENLTLDSFDPLKY